MGKFVSISQFWHWEHDSSFKNVKYPILTLFLIAPRLSFRMEWASFRIMGVSFRMVGLSLRMRGYAFVSLMNQNTTKEATEAKKDHRIVISIKIVLTGRYWQDQPHTSMKSGPPGWWRKQAEGKATIIKMVEIHPTQHLWVSLYICRSE